MTVVKYKNSKMGGMPVTFPILCKNKSSVTHMKRANPFLELTDDEAKALVKADPYNFELADEKEYAEHVKKAKKDAAPRDETASMTDEEKKVYAKARARLPKPPAEEKPAKAEKKAAKGKPGRKAKAKPDPEPEPALEE